MDFINLPEPKTNIQEVLYHMIQNDKVSIIDFPYLSEFRTRISELRRKMFFKTESKNGKNKYGHTFYYHIHSLDNEQKKIAITVYKQLTNGK